MTISDADVDDPEVFEPQLPSSPYPGLRPFQKAEWPIFFGRERMTDNVIDLLMRQRLLVVHGTSGNGKSSLIRAGVLARLEQEHARSGTRWRTCAMSPGDDPLNNLAKSFADAAKPLRRDWIEFRRALNHGRQSANAIGRLLEVDEGNRLCILIDQFEEMFNNFGNSRCDQSTLLTEFLVGFSEDPPDGLFVLVTMRSEFLGLCSRFAGLAEVINVAQYLLPRMETEDLLRAVREPAVLYGGTVTEQLAERLIIDARSSQDELPLIQHGLSQLWESGLNFTSIKAPLVLDLQRYASVGSLSTLISNHADRVAYEAAAPDGSGIKIVEELFRALTAINSEGHAVRRQQSFARLVAITGTSEELLRQILDEFRQPGVSFITPYPPATIDNETLIDISHEALIRHWKKISEPNKGWLQREFRDGLIWQALRVQAESFLSNPANLLSEATTEARSAWLRDRSEGWSRRYGGMWSEVENLVDASRDEIARQKQKDIRNREDIERGKRLRIYMRFATAVSVALIIFAIVLFTAKQRAEREKINADLARGEAIVAQEKAETEKQRALEAKQQAEAEKSRAEEERAKADKATSEAIAAQQRAETDRQRAVEAKQQAEIEKSRAEDEKVKADNATNEAIVAQQRAETEKQIALEAKQQAETEKARAEEERRNAERARQEAELALQKAYEEAKRADDASNRATKFQDESASSYVTSHGRVRDTLARALVALSRERDPLRVAFYGQIVSQLTDFATSDEIQSVMQTLIEVMGRQQDPASEGAIAQALTTLAGNLTFSQAQAEARALLAELMGTAAQNDVKAIALVFGAMAPKLKLETANAMKPFLVKALLTTNDPSAAGVIATALTSLKWAPTSNEADLIVEHFLELLSRTKDQNLVGTLGTVITILSPKLGHQMAQEALDQIRSMGPNFRDPLKSASNALAARVDQSSVLLAPSNLLQRISASRWCTSARSYTMQLVGNSIIWRDNLGSVDAELIVSSSTTDAQTTTQKSLHVDGKNEIVGTNWTYRLGNSADKVYVKSSNGKSFSLGRC